MSTLCRWLRRFRFFLRELQITFSEVATTLEALERLLPKLDPVLVRVVLTILVAIALLQLVLHH